MRIAYVTPYDRAYKSISTHTGRRIAHWESEGCVVEQFVIGGGGRASRGPIANIVNDIRTRKALSDRISRFTPDVIYARWLVPVPGLYSLLARVAPLVVEVHSDDQLEAVRGSFLRRAYLLLFRGRELRAASASTFVIETLEKSVSFRKLDGPRGVFANGSWVSPRDRTVAGGRPRIGMSAAGLNPWVGLDRFRSLADKLANECDFVLICPEGTADEFREHAGESVTVVPTRNENDYLDEVARLSVAVGTMALERSGLTTASPLKVSDYIGLGVPTILPFWHEGLADVESDLILKMAGPGELPVADCNVDEILRFSRYAHGRRLPEAVARSLSAEAIESSRVDFLVHCSKAL